MPLHDADLLALLHRIQAISGGEEVYVVGGSVRDLLLGRPVKDLDLSVGGSVAAYGRRIADALGGSFFYLREGDETARIVLKPRRNPSLTENTAVRAAGVAQIDLVVLHGSAIEEDLRRRDFTINAMGLDLRRPLPTLDPDALRGSFLDPLGGLHDLEHRIVRRCTAQSIPNDPLRMMRAVRFAVAFDSVMEAETWEQIKAEAPSLAKVSAERIRDELFYLLDLPSGASVERGLQLLQDANLLATVLKGPFASDALASVKRFDSLSLNDGSGRPELAAAINSYLNDGPTPPRTRRGLLRLAQILTPDPTWFPVERQSPGLLYMALALSTAESRFVRNVWGGSEAVEKQKLAVADEGRPLAFYRFFRRWGDAIPGAMLLHLLQNENRDQDSVELIHQVLNAWFFERETYLPTPLLSGRDLIKLFGEKGGPWIAVMLDSLQEAQVTGQVTNARDARRWVKRLRASMSE